MIMLVRLPARFPYEGGFGGPERVTSKPGNSEAELTDPHASISNCLWENDLLRRNAQRDCGDAPHVIARLRVIGGASDALRAILDALKGHSAVNPGRATEKSEM